MKTRPIIMYVDDEPHNLVVFEAAMPDSWDIHVFDNPENALAKVGVLKPNVIISDQRMPHLNGVRFLQQASQVHPAAVRILVTGFTDEDLLIESVRSSRIFDYIRKPWDFDELLKRLEAAIQHNAVLEQRESLEAELHARETDLQERNNELLKKTQSLAASLAQLQEIRDELSCWIPPVVTWLSKNQMSFPLRKDLAVLAVGLSGDKSLQTAALQAFGTLVIKHGGHAENIEGETAYANFGLDSDHGYCDTAMLVATDFLNVLRELSEKNQTKLDCSIGLHFAPQTEANISSYHVSTTSGIIVQKGFYTSSPDIDLVHRMEKHISQLPGSNIVVSQRFLSKLNRSPAASPISIGAPLFKGQSSPVELSLLKSNLVSEADLAQFYPRSA